MHKNGFTLIEVLIAVGVLSVASFAFLPSFTGSLNEKKLQQSIEAVRDATATARNRALTEVGSPGAVDAGKYKYSGVKFEDGSGTYYQFRSNVATTGACGVAGSLPGVPAVTGELITVDSTKTLPNGVVARIDVNDSPLCVFFEFKTAVAVTTKGSKSAVSCED
jgi:prepilin-type N-terminal cleavage/methylation domain-containing protein